MLLDGPTTAVGQTQSFGHVRLDVRFVRKRTRLGDLWARRYRVETEAFAISLGRSPHWLKFKKPGGSGHGGEGSNWKSGSALHNLKNRSLSSSQAPSSPRNSEPAVIPIIRNSRITWSRSRNGRSICMRSQMSRTQMENLSSRACWRSCWLRSIEVREHAPLHVGRGFHSAPALP